MKMYSLVLSVLLYVGSALAITPNEARQNSYKMAEAETKIFISQLQQQSQKPKAAAVPQWVKSTLEDWVNTNSGSFNPKGLEEMRAKVKPLFTALGFHVQEIEVGEVADPKGNKFQRKILVFDFPDSNPDILLMGHLDTVFEPFHPFQKFSEDGNLWRGPGVADMKGALILAIHTLMELKDPKYLKRFRIILNDDEERGSATSGPFLKKYADQAKVGLFFEASQDSDVTSSHSGLLWYETTVYGVAAHAGLSHADGVNACLDNSYKMIEMFRLLDYNRGLTINPGIVNTPERAKTNIVCDEIKTSYDIRFVEDADITRTREMFKSVMSQTFVPNLKGAKVPATELKEVQFTRSMPPEKSKRLVEIYKRAAGKRGLTIVAKHKGAVDAYGVIESPLELMSGMGVYGGGMHSENEFSPSDLYMRKLELNLAFFKELID